MVTTGELRAIIQELHFVDVGDAASYLGEEALVVEESTTLVQPTPMLVPDITDLMMCDCLCYEFVHA